MIFIRDLPLRLEDAPVPNGTSPFKRFIIVNYNQHSDGITQCIYRLKQIQIYLIPWCWRSRVLRVIVMVVVDLCQDRNCGLTCHQWRQISHRDDFWFLMSLWLRITEKTPRCLPFHCEMHDTVCLSRPAKPGVQSKNTTPVRYSVSLSNRTHSDVLTFITHTPWIEMVLFFWWILFKVWRLHSLFNSWIVEMMYNLPSFFIFNTIRLFTFYRFHQLNIYLFYILCTYTHFNTLLLSHGHYYQKYICNAIWTFKLHIIYTIKQPHKHNCANCCSDGISQNYNGCFSFWVRRQRCKISKLSAEHFTRLGVSSRDQLEDIWRWQHAGIFQEEFWILRNSLLNILIINQHWLMQNFSAK